MFAGGDPLDAPGSQDVTVEVAVDQLEFTKPQDPARIYSPNGDQIIGGGLERIMIEQQDTQSVFDDIALELEDEAQPVLEQLAEIGG